MTKYRKGKYTLEQLIDACKNSTSYRQVMSKLEIKEAGGNYSTIKQKIVKYQIDISHFTGKGWNVGLKFRPKSPILTKDLLITNSNYQSNKLRLRLLRDNYFEHKCYKCQLTNWLNQPIPLELEHIDGKHENNEITNLTLLCPNCHAQTPTYRNKKRVKE